MIAYHIIYTIIYPPALTGVVSGIIVVTITIHREVICILYHLTMLSYSMIV